MRFRGAALACVVVLALLAAACSVKYGREFPSPKLDSIINGRMAKADLVRMFGEPTQVGSRTAIRPGRGTTDRREARMSSSSNWTSPSTTRAW